MKPRFNIPIFIACMWAFSAGTLWGVVSMTQFKKQPNERSAVRMVLAMQDGWTFQLIRAGNGMTLHAETPDKPGMDEFTLEDVSGDADWLGKLLTRAGVPGYTG
jgi:hypothetical protein